MLSAPALAAFQKATNLMEDILNWFHDYGYWAWWSFAVLLVILEIFSPTFFMLWLGIAAGVVGFAVLLFPGLSWELQWVLFAVISIVSIVAARAFLKKNPGVEDNQQLNQRGAQYIGRIFTLTEAIENGRGKVHVDDTYWSVSGPELPTGEKVHVTATDGVILVVEPLTQKEDKN